MFSVVVPCYNEEHRIGPFVRKLLQFCMAEKNKPELVFVNDGSRDNTLQVITDIPYPNKQVITHERNRGKGYAIRTGVLASRGDYVVFIDADGSIHPSELGRMFHALKKCDVVVASRLCSGAKLLGTRPILRRVYSKTFNLLANFLLGVRFWDTLCGFKGFKRAVGTKLLGPMKCGRWVFDVELFYRIRKENMQFGVLPITWKEMRGSKITMFSWVSILVELVRLRLLANDKREFFSS